MTFVLLLAGLAFYWAWKTRDAQAMRIGDVAAVVAALVSLKLFKGNALLALVALGGAGWWYWFRRGGTLPGRKSDAMSREQARRLLEVPADASADEVRAAHRRLVARVHPDRGGSADLTAQVNAARDALLRRS